MSRMHPQHHMDLHKLYRQMDDKHIHTPRFGSVSTRKAIRAADAISNDLISRGFTVNRTLLVFIDNHTDADQLACIVISVGDNTLVADVNARGSIINLAKYETNTSKRLSRKFMYSLVDVEYDADDEEYETYNTRVYARSRVCYK